MASESSLLQSSGLSLMLRNPRTGETMSLNFDPKQESISLEVHFPARTARARLTATQIPEGGEYDVRLQLDTNPLKGMVLTMEPSTEGGPPKAVIETFGPADAATPPAPRAEDLTSVMPRPSPQAPQAPQRSPTKAAIEGGPASTGPSIPEPPGGPADPAPAAPPAPPPPAQATAPEAASVEAASKAGAKVEKKKS